jgi:hypothetical protein
MAQWFIEDFPPKARTKKRSGVHTGVNKSKVRKDRPANASVSKRWRISKRSGQPVIVRNLAI